MQKIGVFIGRFQPFHLGHQSVVYEIIADGLKPVIVIGSANAPKSSRNPYSVAERRQMIEESFGHEFITILELNDYQEDADWIHKLKENLPENTGVTVYFHRKPSDLIYGVHPLDFLRSYFEVKIATYPTHLGIHISSTDIRSDIEKHKHYVHPHIYLGLKKLHLQKTQKW